MLHLRFSHCTSASLNALEAHWWVIENAAGLVECLHKGSLLPSCSFVDWQRFPVAFQEALLPICSYMFWWGLCSVGCQKRHQDNKSGLRAEWGLSKLCCTRWIGEKAEGLNTGEKMSAQLSRPEVSHSLWLKMIWKPRCFIAFLDAAPYTSDTAHAYRCEMINS